MTETAQNEPISGHSVPNLDAMAPTDLHAFWARYNRCTRAECEALIGDRRPGYIKLTTKLAGYASNKAAAMYCRERGDIQGASIYETICDRMYDELPHDLRW